MKKTPRNSNFKQDVINQVKNSLQKFKPKNIKLELPSRFLKEISDENFYLFVTGKKNRPKGSKSVTTRSVAPNDYEDERSYDSDCYDCKLKGAKKG
jgi:hypothetical protein